jgi:hypothetical protein
MPYVHHIDLPVELQLDNFARLHIASTYLFLVNRKIHDSVLSIKIFHDNARKNCLKSESSLLLYLFLRRFIKLIVVMIEA